MTRKLLITLAASFALAASFFTFQGTAVAQPIVYNWTGFYVGGHLGHGGGTQDWTNIQYPTSGCCAAGLDPGSGSYNGFLGGAQVGFKYQIGQFVLGIEGDLSGSGIKGDFTCFGRDYSATCSSELRWIGTLGGIVGFAFNNILIYGKGGIAVAGDKLHALTVFGDTYDGAATRTGSVIGFGAEFAFMPRWTVKIEYNQMNFDDRIAFAPGIVTSFLGGYDWTTRIQSRVQVIKFGINHRFTTGM